MYLVQVSFLFKRKPDGVECVGTHFLNFRNELEYNNTSERRKIKMMTDKGFDFIRFIEPDESIVGVTFKNHENN